MKRTSAHLRHMTQIWVLAAVLIMGIFGIKADDLKDVPTTQLLKELKALPQKSPAYDSYYDMHGNADPRLQALMIRRFEATKDICAEIEATSAESHPAYLKSLYDVLGTVKDPETISWLTKILKGARRDEVVKHWLNEWSSYMRGAAPEQLKWLEGVDRWSVFFRQWADTEADQVARLTVLRAMQGWLHDKSTQEYFSKLEGKVKTLAEESFLVALYLKQHGERFDEAKLKSAITELLEVKSGQEILLRYAAAIRHEAFVPWLIRNADSKMEVEFMTPQRALEAVTMQRGISGQAGWKEWYGKNKGEKRDRWMKDAADKINSLAGTKISLAQDMLDKAIYTWEDVAMLPHVEKLAAFKPFHNDIAGWINLTYYETPYLRERLKPLALKIRNESEADLKDWAKNLMLHWDFLHEDTMSWEQYIHISNMRV